MNFILEALDKSQATIQFKTDGTIITANKNFLDVLGYSLDEVQGKHHSMFVEPALKIAMNINSFGPRLVVVNFKPKNINASEKVAKKFGYKLLITPSKIKTVRWSRLLSMPQT